MSQGAANAPVVWPKVDALAGDFIALSDRVWTTPELNFQEVESSAEHCDMLEAQGFHVETGLGGLPTAVMGEAGDGGPVIAFLGEFDALPGLSQEAGADEPRPLVEDGNGHGCGHNLLGAGSMLAAAAVKDWLSETGTPGRVRYYGCPAEEGGGGKSFMVREGVFDDVDIAISWHPAHFAGVIEAASRAVAIVDYAFQGRASHAAGAPEAGRSALDAVELMSVGVNYMREHMHRDCNLHYAYLDAGGRAPNVVQANALVRYMIRAPRAAQLLTLVERVGKIAEGAALMTETSVRQHTQGATNCLLANSVLEDVMNRAFRVLGGPDFDAEDEAYAKRLQSTFSSGEIDTACALFGLEPGDKALFDTISDITTRPRFNGSVGSTDVGDVSWKVPTVQAWGATLAIGTQLHTWQATAQGKSPSAHKGMVHVAKAMAATGSELFQHPDLIAAAKAEFAERIEKEPPVWLLPADAMPNLEG